MAAAALAEEDQRAKRKNEALYALFDLEAGTAEGGDGKGPTEGEGEGAGERALAAGAPEASDGKRPAAAAPARYRIKKKKLA